MSIFGTIKDSVGTVINPATSDNQTNREQYTKILDSWGDEIGSTMVDEMMVAEKHRLCGGLFNGTTPDTNFYTTSIVGNATATISNGILDLATTTDANSSVLVYTTGVGRYIGGNMNHLRGIIRIPSYGPASNVRRFGVTKDSSLADSLYIQVEDSMLSIVAKTTGLPDIKIDNGSFNGDNPTYVFTGNFAVIEILYTNRTIRFYLNRQLLHTLTETDTVICGSRHLRPFLQNKNTGVGEVVHGYCQALTLLSWGMVKTQPKYYLQQGTTAGVLLKIGIGSLHMINISGVTNNATITLYDNTSAAGTIIYTTGAMSNQTVPLTVPFNDGVQFINGLYLTITGANCNTQVIYE